MEATTARILDKRRMLKKSGKYRLAIRVTFDRKPIPFPLDLYVTEKDYKKFSAPRISKDLSTIRDKLIEEENRAKDIIRSISNFTFSTFREAFYKNNDNYQAKKNRIKEKIVAQRENNAKILPSPQEGRNKKYGKKQYDRIRSNVDYKIWGPVAEAFGEYIRHLETQERIGSSESYFTALINILKFKNNLRFEDVTVNFLYEYERWMIGKGKSLTTVGIYTRCIRCIINNHIAEGLFPHHLYPFGKRKYRIPKGANIKKSLELSEIKKIYDYNPDPSNKNEGYSRDMWLFGYFCNGINPMDIAYLKFENIDENFVIIKREKTKFTTRTNPRNILIPIIKQTQAIIDRWGNKNKSPNDYVFPILAIGLSAHRRRELVQNFTRLINDWMKQIILKLRINKKVTTLAWRHSFATTLKRSGASTEFIQESLGHTDVRTTENYLDSFDLEIKKKFSRHLSAFNHFDEDLDSGHL